MDRTRTALFAVLIVALTCSTMAITTAHATSPGNPGVLAVIKQDDLSLLNPSTGVTTPLTKRGTQERNPAWSPDGQRLAYESGGSVMVINANGSGKMELVGGGCGGGSPSWNPDGTRILYAQGCGEGLRTIAPDGTDVQPVPNSTGKGNPEWSPDGTKIAYVSHTVDNDYDVWVMDADGENAVQVTNLPGTQIFPSWSPDSSHLVFQDQADGQSSVGIVDVDGQHLQDLTPRDGFDGSPSWSPDGVRIVFSSNRGTSGLFTMAPDGTDVTKIPGSKQMDGPAWQPESVGLGANRSVVRVGDPLILTARLAWLDGGNTEVDILRRAGNVGAWQLLQSGQVDDQGRFALTIDHAKTSASYRATWSGDAEHGAVNSLVIEVGVRAEASGALFRFDGTRNGYRLYHDGDRVWFEGRVTPNRAGERMCFELQYLREGRWRRAIYFCYPIRSNGTTTVYITNSPVGIAHRLRAVFLGDDQNLGDVSPWDHYRVLPHGRTTGPRVTRRADHPEAGWVR